MSCTSVILYIQIGLAYLSHPGIFFYYYLQKLFYGFIFHEQNLYFYLITFYLKQLTNEKKLNITVFKTSDKTRQRQVKDKTKTPIPLMH